jgi:hypothetical protein
MDLVDLVALGLRQTEVYVAIREGGRRLRLT